AARTKPLQAGPVTFTVPVLPAAIAGTCPFAALPPSTFSATSTAPASPVPSFRTVIVYADVPGVAPGLAVTDETSRLGSRAGWGQARERTVFVLKSLPSAPYQRNTTRMR